MNEKQRQLVLLAGFMILLALAFVFVNFGDIQKTSLGDRDDSKSPEQISQHRDRPEDPGLLRQSISGLYSLYKASIKGWSDIANLTTG